MSDVVLKSHGLNVLASSIRDRFKDDTDEIIDEVEPRRLDARERKWAAQKLLEPMESTTVEGEETDVEFELEVLQEYWKLVTGASWNSSFTPEKAQRIASQYHHSKAYVGACWNLKGVDAPPEDELEATVDDLSRLKRRYDEINEDEDTELDLEDDLAIEDDFDINSLFEDLEASKDDEDEDTYPEGEDANEVSDEEEQISAQDLLDEAGVSDGEPREIPF